MSSVFVHIHRFLVISLGSVATTCGKCPSTKRASPGWNSCFIINGIVRTDSFDMNSSCVCRIAVSSPVRFRVRIHIILDQKLHTSVWNPCCVLTPTISNGYAPVIEVSVDYICGCHTRAKHDHKQRNHACHYCFLKVHIPPRISFALSCMLLPHIYYI